MKKLCFLNFEGFLVNNLDYVVDEKKANFFIKKVFEFCKNNNIELFLISGLHEKVVLKKFENSFLKEFITKEHFFFVTDEYISLKHESDEQLHIDNLKNNEFFVDSFFKQTIISKLLAEKNISPNESILFCNDVWVDGYYTTKFSKSNFVIFENNITDRGKKIDKINGLIYFNFDSNPNELFGELVIDYSSLNKYVFDVMKDVLLKDVDFSKLKKKLGVDNNAN
ncbi:MAG: hypothetical protein PHX27_03385 [Candidatus ainarchaeum sp.]|nr:hypothetical protein [Candidatus ainarchaeum sp.]